MQHWFFRSSLQNWEAQKNLCFQPIKSEILSFSAAFDVGCYEFKIAYADWSVSYGAGYMIESGVYQLNQSGGNLKLQILNNAHYSCYWNIMTHQLHFLQIPKFKDSLEKKWDFIMQKIEIFQRSYTQVELKQIQKMLVDFQKR